MEQESKTAFITGASRGVGAAVALQLARNGVSIALNFRSKAPRAQRIAEQIEIYGARAVLAQADITDSSALQTALEFAHAQLGAFDFLILNASGGLERGQAPNYAMHLNRDAQLQTLQLALPFLQSGARVVFVTSHLAHFYDEKPVPDAYETVARSKKAGEIALLHQIPTLEKREVSLVIVSGDAIEGTITLKLLARKTRGENSDSRDPNRVLPSVDEFAATIAKAAQNPDLGSGEVVLVGEVN